MNGFQIRGLVKGFDSYTVVIDSDGRQNLVYKHAISTVIPSKFIPILEKECEKTEDNDED